MRPSLLTLLVLAGAVTASAAERPWVDASAGVRVGQPIALEKAGRAPAIAALGGGYVAAWLQNDPDGERRACVIVLRLGADGRPSAPARRLLCAQDLGAPSVAASGDRAAVAFARPNAVEARILSPELAEVGHLQQTLSRIPEHVSVSHDGTGFVVAWSTYDEAMALSFGPDGRALRGDPVRLSRRTPETDVTHADLACVSTGTCAALLSHFYGNSKTSVEGVRLEGGAPKGGLGGIPGPFDHRVVAGAGQLVAFYSFYDRILGESLLAGNARVFDYSANDHRIRDISGAIGPQGTLVAWWMEPSEGPRTGVSIAYIHPDPNAARPHPLAIPDVISPAVGTLDGRRFVLLTGSYGMGAIQARVVDVDPTRFGTSPAKRGAVLEGVVQGADGRSPTAAQASYFMFLRNGSLSSGGTVVKPDGHFTVPHPHQDDLRANADVVRILLWVQQEGRVSPLFDGAPPAAPLALQLQPATAPARVRLIALSASGEGRYEENLQVLLAPGVLNQLGLHLLGKGRALELENVAPGPTALVVFDQQGFQVSHRIQLQPGADHAVEVPFALELPPGKVGLILDESLAVLAVPPGTPAQRAGLRKGDVVVAVGGQHPANRAQAVELLGGAPGTPVDVTIRRGQSTGSYRLIRSAPGSAPPPKVTVTGPTAAAANSPRLVPSGPGERVIAEQAAVEHEEGGPFRVDMDEAFSLFNTVRVSVSLPGHIPAEKPISLTVTIDGPGDLHQTRQVSYYNFHTVHVGCDPVPGGGPDQCRNNTWEEPAPSPDISFGPDLVNMQGKYRITVAAPGLGEVQRSFLVVSEELGHAYDRHPHGQIGSYRLVARAAVQTPFAGGAEPLTMSRALYRLGARSLIVDVSEPARPGEDRSAAVLTTGRWAPVPWVKGRDDRPIKIDRRPGGFEAAWSTSAILVRVSGAELGAAERDVLDYYQGMYPSYAPAAR